MRGVLHAVLAAVFLAGCGDSVESPSPAFEEDDIKRAEDAPGLVQEYCDGVESEAQRVGCLSHVTVEEVCEQDTAAKKDAVSRHEGACD